MNSNSSNDDVYAAGLLAKALDPSSQPPAIRTFLREEIVRLQDLIPDGARVMDFGCGTGRHLALLAPKISLGVGLDYQLAYVKAAIRPAGRHVHFVVADGTTVPTRVTFDYALCLTNTWGTMTAKGAILAEMRRVAPRPRSRILCVYAESSIPARREWYANLGHEVAEVTSEYLASGAGFRSEHFTEARIRRLVGDCEIRPLAGIAYLVLA